MKKLSKLIITQMNIRQIPCYVCAYEEDGKVMELRFEPVGEKSSLGNIYVGQIENIAANIGAAFVQISAGEKCYLQLSDAPNAIYASVKKGDRPLNVDGRSRTCFSCVYRTEPFYISAVRDANSRNLEEIITDIPEISRQISDYLNSNSPEEKEKLRFYDDKLLPLYKLYRLETVLEEIQHEKVWLNSGGFLVIQQTEAFVSIDVNSGKFTGKKKMQETYRKINLEAAKEIARQLRLRNLSGIILIDFINMENQDHQDELFHVLQKYLRKDPVKAKAVDITPLHILELTRKKVRKPVIEEIREL